MKNARETKTPRIVYAVDVPPLQLTALTEILARHAIGVRSFSGRARLAGVLKRGLVTPACVLLSCDLSARRDRVILGRLARASGNAPVVVLTRAVTEALQADAIRLGAADVVESSMMAIYISLRILDVLGEHNELGGISVDPIVLADNANVVLRPFKPEDARLQSTFLKKLSLRGHSHDVLAANDDERPHDKLTVTLFRNAGNGAAVVAVETVRGKAKIIGIARARLTASGESAGFAVAILKDWRRKGIGSQLLRALIASAALVGVHRLEGYVQRDNVAMLAVARQLGFVATKCHEHRGTCKLSKSLRRDIAVQRRKSASRVSGLRKLVRLREKLVDLRRRLAASARTVWH